MKKSMMGLIVFIVMSAFTTTAVYATSVHGCPDDDTVFAALTTKKTKAVELCKVRNGFQYSFGPKGKAEIVLFKPKNEVSFGGGMAGGFELKNGNFEYSVTVGKFGGGTLMVNDVKKGKLLAAIDLDDVSDEYVNTTYEYIY